MPQKEPKRPTRREVYQQLLDYVLNDLLPGVLFMLAVALSYRTAHWIGDWCCPAPVAGAPWYSPVGVMNTCWNLVYLAHAVAVAFGAVRYVARPLIKAIRRWRCGSGSEDE